MHYKIKIFVGKEEIQKTEQNINFFEYILFCRFNSEIL